MADTGLGPRWRHLARVLRGERDLTRAALRALTQLLAYTAGSLRSSGYDVGQLDIRAVRWDRIVEGTVLPSAEEVFNAAFAAAARGDADPRPYAARHLEAVTNRLSGVPDEVFDLMRVELEAGRQIGESIPQLASRVDALLTDEERWANRATTIARTEVIGANNMGQRGAASATAAVLGVDETLVVKEWVDTSDDRTRETHAEAGGQQVLGLDTPFTVGGSALDVPGDPFGPPEEVINCRCAVVFHYPGDPDYPGDVPALEAAARDTATATIPAPATPVVDAGPQTADQHTARGMTPEQLAAETRTRTGLPKAVARAELTRRGLSAAAQEDDVTTPTPEAEPSPDAQPDAEQPLDDPTHAGIAVQAADTGRVLLIQRSLDQDDAPDVMGTWEFPGGGIEEGETPEAAAWREFGEETGLPAPPGEVTGGWRSPDGVYQGYVFTTPVEDDAFPHGINPPPENRVAVDPDSPTAGRVPDVQAWFTLEQIDALGPALRPAVRDNTDWEQFMPTPQEQDEQEDDTMDDPTTEASGTTDVAQGVLEAFARALAPDDADRQAAHLAAMQETLLTFAEVEAAPPAPAPGTPALAQDIPPDGEPFYGIIWPEDVQSGDQRGIAAGATTWRDLPLPLMAQDATAMGHDGAVRVGRIDTLVRDETTYAVPVIRYAGVWDTSPAALETMRQVDNGVVRGISTDGDAVTVELRDSSGKTLDPMVDDFPEDGVVVEVATAARVSGGTVCSIPAFHQAYVANGRLEDRTEPEPGWNADGTPKDNTLSEQAAPAVAASGEPTGPHAGMAPAWTLVASAEPTAPGDPADFANPGLTEPTRMTITEDGRVFGHLATWGTCHIGVKGVCQEPPVSAANYAYFATGAVPLTDGSWMPVGQLTMDTGHAAMNLRHRAAVAHYDNTGTAVADVVMGQDHIGIWFAGRLRPYVTTEQVYAMRAAGSVSGDWREVAGSLELVAALVVNVPGFPIPAPAVTASAAGAEAMVAAGMVQATADAGTSVASLRIDQASVAEFADAVLANIARRERAAKAETRLRAARVTMASRQLDQHARHDRNNRVAAAVAKIERV